MPINSIKDLVSGLFSIGLRTALQTVQFTREKRALDASYQAAHDKKPELKIGEFISAQPIPEGKRFAYENAELEIRFLKEDLIRVTWSPGQEPLPYALERVEWDPVEIKHEETPEGYWLSSTKSAVGVEKNGTVRIFSASGLLLREEAPPIRQGDGWKHCTRLRDGEAIFGLGERNGSANRRGHSYRMWNIDPGLRVGTEIDPVYICIPVYLSLQKAGACLVFYENYSPAELQIGSTKETPNLILAAFEMGLLREYVIPGKPSDIMERYSELTGRSPLPPRWALGYQQSRWGYKSEADIRRVAERAAQEDIPLSAIHMDIDYMDGFRVFTVNRKRFPDLAKLAGELDQRGIKLVTIIDPGVKIDTRYDVYKSGVSEKVFCSTPDDRIARGVVWPGWAAFPDYTNPRVRRWWGRWYARLLDQGVAGFWHDMNEPACLSASAEVESTLPSEILHAPEGRPVNHRQVHNLYGHLMNRAGYEALKELKPEHRPWILSRSGWAGTQRYAWNWTGDINSSWAALRQSIATLLGMGLSGLAFTGTDIGGYFGEPEPELYIRWIQLACFNALFRGHCAKGFAAHEPWGYGEEALRIARDTIHLRCRLLPYIYTAAWQTSQSGCPMVRPLWWENPDDQDLWNVDDAFLFGDALLVAPVTAPGLTRREVRLPAGQWVDFWSGDGFNDPITPQVLEGGQTIVVDAPLERIPILVRNGSLIPMEANGDLELHPFGEGPWKGIHYHDRGDGYDGGTVEELDARRVDGKLITSKHPRPTAKVDEI
jgi:alpha-glucosidase